ncbi:minor tail protein [Microbacterium phage Gingerbug]|nr:minor tail protein [Microbacterium phage Gingerbug]
MVEASWPFYGVETNETQFSKWARAMAFSGINAGLALTPGTGMQVVIGAGSALVRGVYYENDANKTLTVGAAPASGTRLDAVVLRLDQTANTITAAVKAGTANGSGGSLPSLTQNETTWELLIGIITVAAGQATVTTGSINALRPSTGLRVYPYETAKRPTPAEEVALGVNTSAKSIELWIGGAWIELTTLANMAGTLAVGKGGTGATSAAAARANLGAAPTSHTHPWADVTGKPSTYPPEGHTHSAADVTSGTFPIARGGTGAASAKAALQALGIFVQPTAPAHQKGRVWIPGTAPD